jgi:hypothetical protein
VGSAACTDLRLSQSRQDFEEASSVGSRPLETLNLGPWIKKDGIKKIRLFKVLVLPSLPLKRGGRAVGSEIFRKFRKIFLKNTEMSEMDKVIRVPHEKK